MKKAIIYFLALALLSFSVLAAASSTYTSIVTDKNTATITVTLNESGSIRYYVSLLSTGNAPVFSGTLANGTTGSVTLSTLTPATKYYYKFNGTTNVDDSAYSSTIGNFTTDDYKLNGVARTILNLFTLIFIGFAIVYEFKLYKSNPKQMILIMATTLLGAAILNQWLAALLGL